MEDILTWRTLLREVIRSSQERQLIAQVLDVNPVTLMRWANNTSNPRPETLRALPDAVPASRQKFILLIEQEYPDLFLNEKAREQQAQAIPSAFYARFFHDYTTLPPNTREMSLCLLVVQQLLAQFDPRESGMGVFIVQCIPPSEGNKVRSLFKTLGRGTALWARSLPYETQFFGAESQVGDALQRGHLLLVADRDDSLYPQPPIGAESIVAVPLLHVDRAVGCLCVFSTQPAYFTPSRLALLREYADLLIVAFAPEQFYPFQDITPGVMPSLEEQRPYLATFQSRVLDHLKEATRQQLLLTRVQAERLVWQELERVFLYFPLANK